MFVRALVVVVALSFATRAEAQQVAIPEPPVALCRGDAELHLGHCMRRGEHYELGPYPDGIAGGAGLFGVMYVLQIISTAVSAAQGDHEIGLWYSAERLSQFRDWGYIPLLGPWAKLVFAPPNVDAAGVTLFVFEGIFELTGVVAVLISLFIHPVDDWTAVAANTWRVVPMGNGVGARYVF